MVALLTPMMPDGRIDGTTLGRLIDLHVEAGTNAIVIASTTGEAPTLSPDEHVDIYRMACVHAAGRIPIIAGVGSPSTQAACELAREAAHIGVDAILCVTPYYNRPNMSGLRKHFQAVAEAGDAPLILYDVPQRTGVRMDDTLIVELSGHPQIVGLKDATGDMERAERLLGNVRPGFGIVSGDDRTAFDLMLKGGAGVISVAANVAPRTVRSMCDAVLSGDLKRGIQLGRELEPLYDLLAADTNPIPVKWLAQECGLASGTMREPLVMSPDMQQRLQNSAAFRACYGVLGR